MPEYAWMCLDKQDSEYASGPKYAKIVNMAKFWIWHGFSIWERYTAFWICQRMSWQSSEYILSPKYARILNIAGFWICKSYTGFLIYRSMAEYVWKGREYASICLNLQ